MFGHGRKVDQQSRFLYTGARNSANRCDEKSMSESKSHFWSRPRHHQDTEHSGSHVAWIELFYDLVHVVCVFLLGNYLSHHLSLEGFLVFAALFTMIWMAWGDTVFYTSLYVSGDPVHRLIMALQMCTVMVFAAAIPHIPGKGAVYFAVAYGINRALLAVMYWRALHQDRQSRALALEMVRMFAVFAVLFGLSAFLPAPYNYVLWGILIIALQLGYLLPGIGVMRHTRFVPRFEHLSERFALLMLIVIGEGFFKMVVTLADKGLYKVGPGIFFNYVVGGLSLFALAWIYFDFVGNGEPRQTKKHMSRWWYSHLVIMMAAIMIGVALTGEVKVGFFEPFPVGYAWVGCMGLILYLGACWTIQTAIEARFVHSLYGFGLRAFGIVMGLITIASIGHVPAIVGNMLYGIGLFSQIVIPLMRGARDR